MKYLKIIIIVIIIICLLICLRFYFKTKPIRDITKFYNEHINEINDMFKN